MDSVVLEPAAAVGPAGPAVAGPAGPRVRGGRFARPIARWALVAAGYLVVRGAGLALIQLVLVASGSARYAERPAVLGALRSWDAEWFLAIVDQGYPSASTSGSAGAVNPDAVVFFPGYPAVIWLVGAVTRVPALRVGIAVSAVAGTVAAVVLFVLVEDLYDRRVAGLVVVLWAAQPLSVALSMIYSESLFCALAFGTLLAMRRERWLLAGGLGFLAGTVRAAGMALGAAAVASAAWWWWQRRTEPGAGRHGLRAVALSGLALCGAPLYILLIGLRMGHLSAWFDHQRSGWGNRWDWGSTTAQQVGYELSHTRDVYSAVCALSVLAALLLLALAVHDRVWLGLSAFAAFGIAQAFGGSVMILDKPRYLVPLVGLLLPIAVPLSRARLPVQVGVTAGLAFVGLWVSAHALTVWPYTI